VELPPEEERSAFELLGSSVKYASPFLSLSSPISLPAFRRFLRRLLPKCLGRLAHGRAADSLDTTHSAGQYVRYCSGGFRADLARRLNRAPNRSRCNATHTSTRLGRSLHDAIDGAPRHRADIRTDRRRMP
jgi:hypothetical protein